MIKRLALIIAVLLPCLLMSPLAAEAYNPFSGAKCGSGKTHESAVCHASSGNPISGTSGLIADITNIVAYVAGAAAIIVIIIGAIRYITSGGDPGNVKQGKDAVLYAMIGLAVIVVAKTLIIYVLLKVS